MRDIQRQIGVSGTLHEFFDRVAPDPALRAGSPAEIQREFESIHQRILAHLPEQFCESAAGPAGDPARALI